MTRRERKKLDRKKKAAEIEEEIKNGTRLRAQYNPKKKRFEVPNRLSSLSSPEEEMEDRQKTAENTVKVYYKMLTDLLPRLDKIKDPRKSGMIKHKMLTLLVYGILMSMYHIGSRRNANRKLSKPIFFNNLKIMVPELETMPHADTLARLLKDLEVSQIQDSMVELLKYLIRKKKFKNFMLRKGFLIAVDGTQKFYRNYQWATECSVRHVGKEKTPQYYCYVLEAVMILGNGIVLPVLSEFIENDSTKNKQDCERLGFYRMAKKLRKIFRRTKLTIVADGLYACGPVITMCKKYGWDYMIVLKEDSIPTVWSEALALMRINPEDRLKCYWGDREQIYAWANWIEYEYMAKKVKKREMVNVVICYEFWEEKNSRSSGVTEKKETRYAWLSSKKITSKNVFFRCTKIGRYRWKIENNILVEKHQGYDYEHCYSYDWNAMKGFHYLMKIGHFINVMTINSELLVEKVRAFGIKRFIQDLTDIYNGALLDEGKIKEAREKKFYWKLELAT